jgi:hypothetical protein
MFAKKTSLALALLISTAAFAQSGPVLDVVGVTPGMKAEQVDKLLKAANPGLQVINESKYTDTKAVAKRLYQLPRKSNETFTVTFSHETQGIMGLKRDLYFDDGQRPEAKALKADLEKKYNFKFAPRKDAVQQDIASNAYDPAGKISNEPICKAISVMNQGFADGDFLRPKCGIYIGAVVNWHEGRVTSLIQGFYDYQAQENDNNAAIKQQAAKEKAARDAEARTAVKPKI